MKKPKLRIRFYRNYKFNIIPCIIIRKLMWKDKFGTPRCEREPYFKIMWLWFGVYGSLGDDNYWEQWLWVHKYYDGDIEKAKKEWPWVDIETEKSTWIDY